MINANLIVINLIIAEDGMGDIEARLRDLLYELRSSVL